MAKKAKKIPTWYDLHNAGLRARSDLWIEVTKFLEQGVRQTAWKLGHDEIALMACKAIDDIQGRIVFHCDAILAAIDAARPVEEPPGGDA